MDLGDAAMLRGTWWFTLGASVWLGLIAPAGCGQSSTHAAGGSGGDGGPDVGSGSSSGGGDSGSDSRGDSGSGSGGDTGSDAASDSGGDSSAPPPTVPGFYVSPSGDDKNPGTIALPFLTLPKAQSAMQASASIKTTYLRAGTYALTASSGTSNCDGGMGPHPSTA